MCLNPKHVTQNPKPPGGFTLVEVLVVMVVVGITLALIGLNLMPDDERMVRNEAQRLALLLEQARDEAVAGGEAIAWSAEGERYRFLHQNEEGKWVVRAKDELWRERQFSSGVTLRGLQVNHAAVPSGEPLIFSPAGMGVPFEIELGMNAARIGIVGDAMGKVTLKEAG